MGKGALLKNKFIKIAIAIFVTFVPILVFNMVWGLIVEYLPIIISVLMTIVGGLLIVMYVKGYSWGSFVWRLRNLFVEKEDMRRYLQSRLNPDPLYKSRSVLVVGIGLIVGAVYLLYQYEISVVEQSGVRLIK